MTAGQKIAYGNDSRQHIDLHTSKAVGNERSALIIFIHGGGWYSGSTTDHEDLANYISSNSNSTVALIEYRLTLKDRPEKNKIHHPDHLNDVHSALGLLFDTSNEEKYRYHASKAILVGHSAGGWMVLSAALASESGQSHFPGPIADMPSLSLSIRNRIHAFVAVESIFSLVHLLKMYPSYESFITPAFYPVNAKSTTPYRALEKVGVEAWPISSNLNPKVYIIHSSEDDLLSTDYNAHGVELLKGKGLNPCVDNTSFKGKHDDLLHSIVLWGRLIEILQTTLADA